MNKLLFLILSIIILSLLNVNSASAQFCPPENECLCGNSGYPACCEIEGPGGYNCGGSGATPPPSGGGGGYQYPTCGGGRVVKCGTPGLYAWDGGTFAHCRNRADCGNTYGAASLFTQNGCDGVETKGSCQINCSCCNPSDNYVKTTTTGGTYEISNSCHNPTRCSDWDDTYISNRPAPATVANRCYQGCNNCGTDEEDVFWVYNVITTCRTVTTTWACQPTCTPASPSQPQLLTPTNGASVSTTTPDLSWNPNLTSWGTSCTTTNRTFQIYAGPVGSTMALIGTVNSATGTVPFSGTAGITYQWKVRANNNQATSDSTTWTFTINPGPWWQAKDADLTTNGSISSTVPSGQLFDTVGIGGFPGVPVYGSTLNVGSGQISGASFNWNANTTTIQPRLFNYLYFDNLIPESVRSSMTVATDTSLRSTGFTYQGYEWFKSDGSLTIASNIDFGTRKVILFVENGGFGINGKINLNDGFGFFGAFVEGNIVVDPAVTGAPSIEGVYLTDLGFSSSISTLPLHVRGSIVSHGGVSLSRSLTNNTNPAELFEYAPDQILLFPDNLRYKRTKWTEIAP